MSNPNSPHEARVAVLVDCDNVPTDIVEHALRMVAQFGRVVLRRGYGNHATLDGRTPVNPWISIPATGVSGTFTGGVASRAAGSADISPEFAHRRCRSLTVA